MKTNFDRNNYGEINMSAMHSKDEIYLRDLQAEAFCMIADAGKKRKIPCSYNGIDRDYRKGTFSGNAVHHEIYDISEDARHILVCVRETEGSKYGVRTTLKTYFIISAHGKTGLRVKETSKAKAAKAAKQAKIPGDAISVCLGKKKLTVPGLSKFTGYKIVKMIDDQPVSVYDNDVAWDFGKTKRQGATNDHTGGYYVFDSTDQAIKVFTDNNVFPDNVDKNGKFALIECECKGRRFRHDNKKICTTSVKPTKIIANFI